MANLLQYSVFSDVLFPSDLEGQANERDYNLQLRRSIRFQIAQHQVLAEHDLVVFDFETTGLDARQERIIEIGAQRLRKMEVIDEYSTLVDPEVTLSETITKITGLDNKMLAGQPRIAEVMPAFLRFIEGSVLVAHNAEFDMAFLSQSCFRLGYDLSWPAFCTLKLARVLLPELESKNLDTLAKYYDLQFEARHRSIGDVKVTVDVLRAMLDDYQNDLETWGDFQPYWVTKS